MGSFGGLLGASSVLLGGVLGAFWRARGSAWGGGLNMSVRVPTLGPLGPLGAVFGGLWRLMGRIGVLLVRLGALLGALLGRLGAILGASWAVLGRSWGPLGPFWSVGKPKRRERRNLSENYGKTYEYRLFLHLWALLGVLLERSWRFFGASWAVWEASWAILAALVASQVRLGSHLGHLGRLGERQGRVWAPTEPREEGAMHADRRASRGGGP